MKDLCDATGLGRQAIHFYIREGLLPEGTKTGRNMAYYSPTHIERLQLIRRLQEEQFLPLKAIRAVLDAYDDRDADTTGEDGAPVDAFSPAQRQLLQAVKQRLNPVLRQSADSQLTPVAPLLARLAIDRSDFDDLLQLGLICVTVAVPDAGAPTAPAPLRGRRKPAAGIPCVRGNDVWLLELLSALRRIGLTRALGFLPADLMTVDEAVSTLFRKEIALLRKRLAQLDADTAAALVEQALPLMNQLLVRLHESKVRNFIAAL